MALRNIIKTPDEILGKAAREVKEITAHIKQTLDDMWETLDSAEGVGLAAPQIGVLRRLAIVRWEETKLELINPEIISAEGSQTGEEACLSVSDRRGIVTRPQTVIVAALDRDGIRRRHECSGMLARAVCHEIDHLSGKLFLDIMEREIFEDGEADCDE